MQARFKNENDIKIVELFGRVEIEASESFRANCLNGLQGQKVIFDLAGLNFVGSTGILAFLESLQDFAMQNPNRFKFCHVGSEFKKIFAATSLNCIEVFESLQMAVTAYQSIQTSDNVVAEPIPFKRDASIFKDLDIIENLPEDIDPEMLASADAGLEIKTT